MKKICVITGATSGIGNAIAHGLAKLGHTVVMIGRNDDKGLAAREKIQKETGNADLHYFTIDLSSQLQIKSVGEKIARQFPTIDVLINNAAQWMSNYELSEDGIEKQFAVNHIAYFLLTHILYSNISKSQNGRIINIGSDSHRYGKMNFSNYNLKDEYHGLKAYGQSKLANLLFSYHLHRNKQEKNLSVYCVQPGLVKTDIGVKHTTLLHSIAWKLRRLSGITTEQAASNIIFLATDPDVANKSGLYWASKKPKSSSTKSMSVEDAERLWKLSEKLCGINNFFSPGSLKDQGVRANSL